MNQKILYANLLLVTIVVIGITLLATSIIHHENDKKIEGLNELYALKQDLDQTNQELQQQLYAVNLSMQLAQTEHEYELEKLAQLDQEKANQIEQAKQEQLALAQQVQVSIPEPVQPTPRTTRAS